MKGKFFSLLSTRETPNGWYSFRSKQRRMSGGGGGGGERQDRRVFDTQSLSVMVLQSIVDQHPLPESTDTLFHSGLSLYFTQK